MGAGRCISETSTGAGCGPPALRDPLGVPMAFEDLEQIKAQINPTLKELHVLKAILFGSTSRGTRTRKSDVDLLLVVETEERFFDRYKRFDDIFSLLKGRSVDLLIYTPTELDRIAHRPFIRKILAEGQTIYEH